MPKQLLKALPIVSIILFLAGCASSNPNAGKITTKGYIADKERVDQEMEGGNFGYLVGTPKADDRSEYKKTRKIYVVEVTKKPGEVPDTVTSSTTSTSSTSEYEAPAREEARAEEPSGRTIELPDFDDRSASSQAQAVEKPAAPSGGGVGQNPTEYTVQKDDTLQKISKKFYNTYSKWPKIYEANKDVIPNPNRIKPGVKIQIP